MKPLLLLAALLLASSALAQPSDAVTLHHSDLQWTELIPGVSFASTYGVFTTEAHGKFIRFDGNLATPMHTHTYGYHGVVISGRLAHPYADEEEPPRFGPGDYFFVPGGAAHVTACVSEEPCLFYTYADNLWDIEVVED